MPNYNLLPNEYFILNNDIVRRGSSNSSGELVLTNLNLVFVTKKGIFKTTYIPQLYPVNQIKVLNGKAQVFAGRSGEIKIFFINGTKETFEFYCDGKKRKQREEVANWINVFDRLLSVHIPSADSSVIPAASNTVLLPGAIQGAVNSLAGAMGIKTKQIQNQPPPPSGPPVFAAPSIKSNKQIASKCSNCGAPISGTEGQVVRCQYCETGQKL